MRRERMGEAMEPPISRSLAIAMLRPVVALVLPRPSLACSCVADDLREHATREAVVVHEKVVEVEEPPRWQQYSPWNWDTPAGLRGAVDRCQRGAVDRVPRSSKRPASSATIATPPKARS